MKLVNFEHPVTAKWLRDQGHRLDVEPFISGAVEARILLSKLSVKQQPLNALTKNGDKGIYHAGRIKRQWVESGLYGIPFLSSTAILQADLSSLRFISKRAVNENPKLIIHKDWILITRSGSIGRMAFVRSDMDGMACSEDVLRVVPDSERILPGYLYAYLSSEYGKAQVVSGTYGAIIQHIEPEHIAELPVPRFGAKVEGEVHELVGEAAILLSDYRAAIDRATASLFESVGLSDITAAEWHATGSDIGFEVAQVSVKSLRALNFNPRYRKLCKKIQSVPWRRLGDICVPGTLKREGRYKRIDAAPPFAYQLIGQKHLFWLKPEGRWVAKSALGPDVLVKPGTVLVAARGTLGESELYCRAEFAWSEGTKAAYSEDILRVLADENIMPRGCLFAFMRSETAFRMLRSISIGTKLQDHHYVYRSDLPVPYPDRDAQEKIHQMVTKAYDKRYEAIALQDKAVQIIHDQVEGTA